MTNEQNTFTTTPVGEIVAENYLAAGIFREYGIDFCCGGGITLKEACEKKRVDPNTIEALLHQLSASTTDGSDNYNEWSPGFLIDYIINTHHAFVRKKTREIAAYAQKVATVHGERHPWNVTIFHDFIQLANEMQEHLQAEEETVFPLIRQIAGQHESGDQVDDALNASLKKELDAMYEEHNQAGGLMEKIRETSNNFTPPEDACMTYQVLYKNLAGFEADLHKHVHLENNILFRKAEAMTA